MATNVYPGSPQAIPFNFFTAGHAPITPERIVSTEVEAHGYGFIESAGLNGDLGEVHVS